MEISVPILKILVINDDQASLLALRTLLEVAEGKDRFQVLTAASGKEALRLVLRHDFVVILCDVNMPEMDGFETAEAIRVSDNGVGIAAELLPHVFEFFVQGEAVLERANGGLGVGLSLVRRLIEMHDGKIRVESAGVGKGTAVEVRLPRCEPVKIAPDQSQVSFSGNQQTVLLIEDNGDSREMMAEILRAHGYAVLEAADGMEGCRVAKDHLPNFALIDIGLPGIDGYEVARRLRGFEAAKGIQLIALTGYGLEEDKARVLAAGFDLHLVKPVNINYLLGILTPAQSTR